MKNNETINNMMNIFISGYENKGMYDVLDIENQNIISIVVPDSRDEEYYPLRG